MVTGGVQKVGEVEPRFMRRQPELLCGPAQILSTAAACWVLRQFGDAAADFDPNRRIVLADRAARLSADRERVSKSAIEPGPSAIDAAIAEPTLPAPTTRHAAPPKSKPLRSPEVSSHLTPCWREPDSNSWSLRRSELSFASSRAVVCEG